jgi:hypothetical protein
MTPILEYEAVGENQPDHEYTLGTYHDEDIAKEAADAEAASWRVLRVRVWEDERIVGEWWRHGRDIYGNLTRDRWSKR